MHSRTTRNATACAKPGESPIFLGAAVLGADDDDAAVAGGGGVVEADAAVVVGGGGAVVVSADDDDVGGEADDAADAVVVGGAVVVSVDDEDDGAVGAAVVAACCKASVNGKTSMSAPNGHCEWRADDVLRLPAPPLCPCSFVVMPTLAHPHMISSLHTPPRYMSRQTTWSSVAALMSSHIVTSAGLEFAALGAEK